MVWVEFKNNYDWKPKQAVTISYRAGQRQNIPHNIAEDLIAKGFAVAVKAPKKAKEAKEDNGKPSES